VDTYDTEAAVAKVVAIAPGLAAEGIAIGGVRLDSGDLDAHARASRALLDAGGLRDAIIFASGNLDEHRIAALVAAQAPIDGYGIGTALDTSSDAPSLDMVYKLQWYAGRARRKRSEGKATWPGIKQVARRLGADGRLAGDTVHLVDEAAEGVPLLQPCMHRGARVAPAPTLADARAHHARERARLPAALRGLEPSTARFPVEISAGLQRLAAEVDAATR
jgi:nicotinate phosphoribosyltransferase